MCHLFFVQEQHHSWSFKDKAFLDLLYQLCLLLFALQQLSGAPDVDQDPITLQTVHV